MMKSFFYTLRNTKRYILHVKSYWGRMIFRFIYAIYLWLRYVPFHKCVYVKIPFTCRLGNQMFMTAFGETLKAKYKKATILYYTYNVEYYCKDIDPWIFKRFKILTFPMKFRNCIDEDIFLHDRYSAVLNDCLKEGNVMISGYFENISLYDEEFIRSLHICPKNIQNNIKQLYPLPFDKCVSIHVRRGDFVKMGVALDSKYYKNAMSYYPSDSVFVVISDDIEWCKRELENDNVSIIYVDKHSSKENEIYEDLFIPSFCLRGNILSCSSFSWWGSMLNKGVDPIRIMPSKWWSGEKNKPLYFENAIILDL